MLTHLCSTSAESSYTFPSSHTNDPASDDWLSLSPLSLQDDFETKYRLNKLAWCFFCFFILFLFFFSLLCSRFLFVLHRVNFIVQQCQTHVDLFQCVLVPDKIRRANIHSREFFLCICHCGAHYIWSQGVCHTLPCLEVHSPCGPPSSVSHAV